MVNQIINATYTETYDINTAVGELSLLGIHTPLASSLKTQFKGLFSQYKKVKIHGCDVALACASTQSLDPSQMGLEAGQVDPRDVMNPILFKACTGEKMNVLLDQIYDTTLPSTTEQFSRGSISQRFDTKQSSLAAYYSLLSDDSFRKAHPQNGMIINGLKPLVRKIVTTNEFKLAGKATETQYAENAQPQINGGTANGFGGDGVVASNGSATLTVPNVFMTNGTTDLPAIDTVYESRVSIKNTTSGQNQDVSKQYLINNIPRVYMGVFVLPPAIIQRLFFRMSIRWHISFYEFRPAIDLAPLSGLNTEETIDGMEDNQKFGYYNLYHNATPSSKTMSKDYGSFTTNEESEVNKIMEKGA